MKSLCKLPILLGLLTSALAGAQPPDREQPISIRSDRADYAAGKGVYEGNVIIEQGSLYITADRVTVFEENQTVERLVAHGKPARFHQTDTDEELRASANTVEYHVGEEQIVLLRNATVDRAGSEIHGNRIVYDSRKKTVSAEGDAQSADGRVKMILQPRQAPPLDNKSEANADSESP